MTRILKQFKLFPNFTQVKRKAVWKQLLNQQPEEGAKIQQETTQAEITPGVTHKCLFFFPHLAFLFAK